MGLTKDSRRFSRSSILNGSSQEEVWSDLDQFFEDNINEILPKLASLDDDIWGKIIIMERNKRTAKAYLRTTSVIVDGSRTGFDGRTIGFNSFENPFRDDFVQNIKTKIVDGVQLRIDSQGNVLAIARGMSPVMVQGWTNQRMTCCSVRVVRQQGRLQRADPAHPDTERERIVKVFDMKLFKKALQAALQEPTSEERLSLVHKTCIRISLVKDGGEPIRTPCWFMLINLVALDMLQSKFANLPALTASNPSMGLSRTMSTDTINPSLSLSDLYGSLQRNQSSANLSTGSQASLQQQLQTQQALVPLLAALGAASGQGSWMGQALGPNAPADAVQQLAAQLSGTLQGIQYGRSPSQMTLNPRTRAGGYTSDNTGAPVRRTRLHNKRNRSSAGLMAQRWGHHVSSDTIYEPHNEDEDTFGGETTDYGSVTDCGSTRTLPRRLLQPALHTTHSVPATLSAQGHPHSNNKQKGDSGNFTLRSKPSSMLSNNNEEEEGDYAAQSERAPATPGIMPTNHWSTSSLASDYESGGTFSSLSQSSQQAEHSLQQHQEQRSTSSSVISDTPSSELQTSDSGNGNISNSSSVSRNLGDFRAPVANVNLRPAPIAATRSKFDLVSDSDYQSNTDERQTHRPRVRSMLQSFEPPRQAQQSPYPPHPVAAQRRERPQITPPPPPPSKPTNLMRKLMFHNNSSNEQNRDHHRSTQQQHQRRSSSVAPSNPTQNQPRQQYAPAQSAVYHQEQPKQRVAMLPKPSSAGILPLLRNRVEDPYPVAPRRRKRSESSASSHGGGRVPPRNITYIADVWNY